MMYSLCSGRIIYLKQHRIHLAILMVNLFEYVGRPHQAIASCCNTYRCDSDLGFVASQESWHAAFNRLTYGPMLQRDQERIANLNYIYNCNDVEAIQMLRIRRDPFSALVKTFTERGLLVDSIHTSRSPCFFMLWVIIRGSE
jgi:hypothetical protein